MPSRWLLVALLTAIALHAVELYQFNSFEFDKVNHVAATASWLSGRGFTIPDVAPAGLPRSVYRPLLGFLPGYALALAPLMRLTHDIWWSTYALDMAAQSLFLIAWAALLRLVTGSWTPAVGLLLLWTVLYSPIAAGTYTDLLALSLFSAAVATAALAISNDRRIAWIGALTSAAFIVATCVVRYAYWPLAVAIPVAMVVARRDRTTWTFASLHAAAAATAVALTAAFMQRSTGEALFLTRWYPDQIRAFYWRQLVPLDPFPASAVGAGRVYGLMASGRPRLTALAPLVLWMVSALCAIVVIAYLASRTRRWIARQLDAREAFFQAAGVLACAATVAMNLWLTVRLPAASDGWSVGSDPRYFMPVLPFLAAWLWLAARDTTLGAPVRAIAVGLLAGALTITVPVRIVRVERYFAKNRETAWLSRGRRDQADVIFAAIRAVDAGGAPPLFIDDSPKWRRYVATMGGALVVKHAALTRCAEHDVADMRFLTTVPLASAQRGAQREGTRMGVAEDIEIVSMVGSPCESTAAAH
jgi:hypothetical protein